MLRTRLETRSMADPLHVIVLAAGEGKRMKSMLPKVLMPLAGRPMLAHVLDTARALRPEGLHVVYGHRGEQVRTTFARDTDIHWVHQSEQRGTGHAVKLALHDIPDPKRILDRKSTRLNSSHPSISYA